MNRHVRDRAHAAPSVGAPGANLIEAESSVSRAIITAAFLLLSVAVLWVAFVLGTSTPYGDLLLNLGTEIMGIVITVAVVELFLERRRLQNRARQVAWNALHAVEKAVWVWQGGPRVLETDELLGLLSAVGEDDPLPDFTQNLLLGLGTRSKQSLKNDQAAIETMPGLREALENLARMSSLRDGGDVTPPRKVADILSQGVSHIALVLKLSDERIPARLIRYRDPSLESQERRHFGAPGADGGRRNTSVLQDDL